MLSLRPLILAVLVLCLLAITTVSGLSPNRVPRSPTTKDQKKLQEILSNADPASLHDVVHDHIDTYQPSVHQEEKVALATIYEQKAEVASSMVNLAKRQDVPSSNGTTGSVVSTVTTTAVTTTESTSTVTTPITSSTSTTESSSSSSLPSSSSQTTTSPNTTPTTPSSSSSSSVTSSSGSTSSSGPTRTTPSISQALPTTPLSSTTSTTQSVTSLEIVTTTLPDGAPTTITRTTVVPADQPDKTALGGSSSKTNTAVAGLQTNGASKKRVGMGGITGVILGAAGYLLSGIL